MTERPTAVTGTVVRDGTAVAVLLAEASGGLVAGAILAAVDAMGRDRLESNRFLAVGIADVGRGKPEVARAFLTTFFDGDTLVDSAKPLTGFWADLRGVAATVVLFTIDVEAFCGRGSPNPAHFALKIVSSSLRMTCVRSFVLTSSSVGVGGRFSDLDEVRM